MKKLLLIVAFSVTGTSIAEQKLTSPLVVPPDTVCEETQDLLTCDELLPTVCEVTEGERISYLAYISGAVNSSDDLYTTTCKEQSLEGLQRMGSSWQTAERPLRTYFIQKTKGCGYLDDGMNINGYNYKTACYLISDNEYPDYPDDLMCTEIWTLDTNELYKIACQVGINNFVFSPNDWFHKSNFHGDIKDFGYVHNRDTYRQDMLTVSVGRCSL